MKNLLALMIMSLVTLTACAKEEPKAVAAVVQVKAEAKAEVKAEEPKTKKVCVDKQGKDGKPVLGKDGKPLQNCRTVKLHKKHEGTEVPGSKK